MLIEEEQPSIFLQEDANKIMYDGDGLVGRDPFEGEDDIWRMQKLDFVTTISSLYLLPKYFSRMKIPLYCLVPMPMVRPTLGCNLTKLV